MTVLAPFPSRRAVRLASLLLAAPQQPAAEALKPARNVDTFTLTWKEPEIGVTFLGGWDAMPGHKSNLAQLAYWKGVFRTLTAREARGACLRTDYLINRYLPGGDTKKFFSTMGRQAQGRVR